MSCVAPRRLADNFLLSDSDDLYQLLMIISGINSFSYYVKIKISPRKSSQNPHQKQILVQIQILALNGYRLELKLLINGAHEILVTTTQELIIIIASTDFNEIYNST